MQQTLIVSHTGYQVIPRHMLQTLSALWLTVTCRFLLL